jgi:hypothetical protein
MDETKKRPLSAFFPVVPKRHKTQDKPAVHLAIVGYRQFNDYKLFCTVVDAFIASLDKKPASVISGGCRGADSMAERYAKEKDIPMDVLRPDPSLGIRGFIVRDKEIAKKCTHMVAFPSKEGSGTQKTIGFARNMGKPIREHWI